jgi:hypothetical protein
MDIVTISQIANPILQTVFIAVIGLGYYYTVRATQATVAEMRAEHTAGGGRPLVTVSEDYANLPNISLIVQNVGQGPAKDISFEFSAPVESSDELVLSELPFFEEGLTSLAPGAKKAAARAYRPAIVRLPNGRYACFQAGDPLPQGARAVSRWGTNRWRAYE